MIDYNKHFDYHYNAVGVINGRLNEHVNNDDIHLTADDRSKLENIGDLADAVDSIDLSDYTTKEDLNNAIESSGYIKTIPTEYATSKQVAYSVSSLKALYDGLVDKFGSVYTKEEADDRFLNNDENSETLTGVSYNKASKQIVFTRANGKQLVLTLASLDGNTSITKTVYCLSEDAPATPVGGQYNFTQMTFTFPDDPNGEVTWTNARTTLTGNIWMSQRTFWSSGDDEEWSSPMLVSGSKDMTIETIRSASRVIVAYAPAIRPENSNSEYAMIAPTTPTGGTYDFTINKMTSYPNGWYDKVDGTKTYTTSDNKTVAWTWYFSIGTIGEGETEITWSEPAVFGIDYSLVASNMKFVAVDYSILAKHVMFSVEDYKAIAEKVTFDTTDIEAIVDGQVRTILGDENGEYYGLIKLTAANLESKYSAAIEDVNSVKEQYESTIELLPNKISSEVSKLTKGIDQTIRTNIIQDPEFIQLVASKVDPSGDTSYAEFLVELAKIQADVYGENGETKWTIDDTSITLEIKSTTDNLSARIDTAESTIGSHSSSLDSISKRLKSLESADYGVTDEDLKEIEKYLEDQGIGEDDVRIVNVEKETSTGKTETIELQRLKEVGSGEYETIFTFNSETNNITGWSKRITDLEGGITDIKATAKKLEITTKEIQANVDKATFTGEVQATRFSLGNAETGVFIKTASFVTNYHKEGSGDDAYYDKYISTIDDNATVLVVYDDSGENVKYVVPLTTYTPSGGNGVDTGTTVEKFTGNPGYYDEVTLYVGRKDGLYHLGSNTTSNTANGTYYKFINDDVINDSHAEQINNVYVVYNNIQFENGAARRFEIENGVLTTDDNLIGAYKVNVVGNQSSYYNTNHYGYPTFEDITLRTAQVVLHITGTSGCNFSMNTFDGLLDVNDIWSTDSISNLQQWLSNNGLDEFTNTTDRSITVFTQMLNMICISRTIYGDNYEQALVTYNDIPRAMHDAFDGYTINTIKDCMESLGIKGISARYHAAGSLQKLRIQHVTVEDF